jgi:hypothetical protein
MQLIKRIGHDLLHDNKRAITKAKSIVSKTIANFAMRKSPSSVMNMTGRMNVLNQYIQ